MATAIEDFRQVSRSETDPQDAHREFYRLTPGKKMIVMLGGPCMNLLIYLVITLVLLLTLGTPHDDPTTQVQEVIKCVVPATSADAQSTTCPAGAKVAPAFGRLRPGDRVLSADGTRITSWNQLVDIIQPSAGRTLSLVVLRDGARTTVHITPVRNTKYVDGSSTKTADVGYLGVSPVDHHYYAALSIGAIPGQIGSQLKLGVDALGQYPSKLHSLWGTVFEGHKRDPQGAVGVVGIGRISGDFARSTALTVQDKLYTLLGVLASVNLLLFFFNLLPLLPLDGGHVLGAIVEAGQARACPAACPRPPPGARRGRAAGTPATDLRRHRADAAGDVRRRVRAGVVDVAHVVRRHRQAD